MVSDVDEVFRFVTTRREREERQESVRVARETDRRLGACGPILKIIKAPNDIFVYNRKRAGEGR